MPAALNPRHAVYAGSFDPLTLGHLNIVERGAALFDELTLAIGVNPDKQPLFELAERKSLIERAVAEWDNVRVVHFHGLAVNFCEGMRCRGVAAGYSHADRSRQRIHDVPGEQCAGTGD